MENYDYDAIDEEREEEIQKATELLPGWFVPQMMREEGRYALLVAPNIFICIDYIEEVNKGDGGVFLNVHLCFLPENSLIQDGLIAIDRVGFGFKSTIAANKIIAAFELR